MPIEVKLTDRPSERDSKYVQVFLDEYGAERGFVVCTAPRPVRLSRSVTAVPWQNLPHILEETA